MNVQVIIHTKTGKGGKKFFETREQAHEWIGKHQEKLIKAEIVETMELGAHLGDIVHSGMPLSNDREHHIPAPVGSMRQFAHQLGLPIDALEQMIEYGFDDDEDRERVLDYISAGKYDAAKEEMLYLGVINEAKVSGKYAFSNIFGKKSS